MTSPPGDPHGPASVPCPGRRGSILVVDDEEMIRRLAQIILTGDGFQVTEVGTRSDAIETVRVAETPFDLVLLDLTLPDGDGLTAIPVLRNLCSETRMLVMSGLGHGEVSGTACEGFLAKPFTRTTLLAAVHKALAIPRR